MPYILNTQKDIKDILKCLGLSSIDGLFKRIPEQLKLKNSVNLLKGLSEFETKNVLMGLADKNISIDSCNSFLGAGCYDHYIPAALSYILSIPQFLTAYTPYQAECSQGILQAIYEYQTYICLLTGMDVSNASLFDGASALSEAVLMALRINKKNKILISQSVHPEYKETLKTYLSGLGFIIKEVGFNNQGIVDNQALFECLDDDVSCFAFQSPNFFGLIENVNELVHEVKGKCVIPIMATNPLSLSILKEPGALGVDIVCGDGQTLGGNLNYGGPSFGFIATGKKYIRQIPGRIVGATVDKEGKDAYCLTLQTREQHIRREKATSNICSNQSLNAIGAAVYLSLLGKEGLKDAALYSFSNAQYLYKRLKEVRGINVPFKPTIFNEFIWEVEDALIIIEKLYKRNIIPGYYLEDKFPKFKNCILSCCTEKKNKKDIDDFINAIAEVLHG
ncbi:MAG: aminomethyl-transferring glycine dehydrogenase subunit GcvPA [Candidatus Omnitrophica bacterium]|nr:aminomethyl-transferring glycine dehydrogenase subunit GcvPA [Candidatus Omnitrophota bacterium]MCK5392800.1 aminomethyl-transferring glycine dehydrogenase subunit GcvPA [Candidatus Omnitrophota bacterium]